MVQIAVPTGGLAMKPLETDGMERGWFWQQLLATVSRGTGEKNETGRPWPAPHVNVSTTSEEVKPFVLPQPTTKNGPHDVKKAPGFVPRTFVNQYFFLG